jgi:tRNA-modifying protein YgfZ
MFSLDGYQALRHGAGVVRRSDRGVLAVTGADRLTWLQGLLTNDVAALPAGGVCDAAYLTPQGRMIADMRVVNGADRVLLDVPARLAADLRTKLDGLLFAEEARIVDDSSRLAVLEAHGPLVAALGSEALNDMVSGAEAVVSDAPFGVPGIGVFVEHGGVDAIVGRMKAAGAVDVSLETLDVLRVEAGRPAFFVDMDEHTIPLEAGIEDRAISFTKGCYVGQEVIVRVMHRGQGRVARKLVGLRLETSELPAAGAKISVDAREVGRVTSAVWSPALQGAIALGYVHRDFTAAGTAVRITSTDGSFAAAIVELPFVAATANRLSAQA